MKQKKEQLQNINQKNVNLIKPLIYYRAGDNRRVQTNNGRSSQN